MSEEYDVFKNCPTFDDTFGTFKPMSITEPVYKPAVITTIKDGRAHPCNHCGLFPRIHEITFKDTETHPNRFYIDCENCNWCDGNWYETEEKAIEAWNMDNPLTKVEMNEREIKVKQFLKEVATTCRIED